MWPPKNNFRKKQPLAALPADWLNTIANFCRDLKVMNGHIEKPRSDGRGALIVVDATESAMSFHPDHSFKFTQTSKTGGDVTAGSVYLAGISKTITDLPASLASLTGAATTNYYYIEVDLENSTATWKTNTTGFIDGTDTLERIPVFEITTDAQGITSYIQRCTSDIHIPRAA